jgi:hypothetical protein
MLQYLPASFVTRDFRHSHALIPSIPTFYGFMLQAKPEPHDVTISTRSTAHDIRQDNSVLLPNYLAFSRPNQAL